MGQRLGFDDIDFEDAKFSAQYAVRSPNRRAAHELVSPTWITLLSERTGWSVETSGKRLLVWRRGRATPQTYIELFDLAVALATALPRTVVNEERARRGLEIGLDVGAASAKSRAALTRLDQGLPVLARQVEPCDVERFRAERGAP